MEEIVVYTALFGGYDKLIEPRNKYEGCKFICFTDDEKLDSNIWEIKIVDKGDFSNHMMNRRIKLFPHIYLQDYKYSLYVDSNIEITGNPRFLFSEYTNKNIFLPKHMERNCIYDEAKECVKVGKENEENVSKLMEKYKEDGYPKSFGLFENNIIFRRHNSADIKELMEFWWLILNEYSQRDQLSFCYAAWKKKVSIGVLREGSKNKNSYFRVRFHSRERELPLKNKIILFVNMNKHRSAVMKYSSHAIASFIYLRNKLFT